MADDNPWSGYSMMGSQGSGYAAPRPASNYGGNLYQGDNTGIDPTAVNKWLDPSMQFQMDQGMNALNSSAAARGGTFSGQTLKDIMGFSQGLAQTGYNSAYDKAMAQRQFTQQGSQFDRNLANQMGMSQNSLDASLAAAAAQNRLGEDQLAYQRESGDRAFDYAAQQNDQNTPWNRAMQLANLGMQGSGGYGNISAVLAGILGNNAAASGNAQGAGTIGANASNNQTISNIISQLFNNRTMTGLGFGS